MADTALQKFHLLNLTRAHAAWLGWLQAVHRDGRARIKPANSSSMEMPREIVENLVEAEVIPRLMLIHQNAGNDRSDFSDDKIVNVRRQGFGSAEISRFAARVIEATPEAIIGDVNTLRADGFSLDHILLRLLAPVARRLGEMWQEDSADFADVTIAMMKLHRVLDSLHARGAVELGAGADAPSILLMSAPGEQHRFGLVMVGEFFTRSGWKVLCEPDAGTDDVLQEVAAQHFDVIGISASTDRDVKVLRKLIERVRLASLNPDVRIMVGGGLFSERCDLVQRVGADAMAVDGIRAVVTAERMVEKHGRVRVTRPH